LNYFFGDIIILGNGNPHPDMSIYGNNPIKFIITIKRLPSNMIAIHRGELHALFKTHYTLIDEFNFESFMATVKNNTGDLLLICIRHSILLKLSTTTLSG
jgi:hypothetical protein